ncbi:MAG: hypothetical protein WKF87_16290 [Chryseolinea sp.]
MNTIDVKFTCDESELSKNIFYLTFDLAIDGCSPLKNNDDSFDIHDFIMSTRKDGTYFIWTCSCGDAECAGYVNGIEVRIGMDVTLWVDHDLEKTYIFDTHDLQAKAFMLENEISKWDQHAKSNGAELCIWPSWSMKYLLPALGIGL